MELREIVKLVIGVVSEIQELSGRPVPEFMDTTKPMSGLSGFDSLNAIEACIILSGRFGCKVPDGLFFTSKKVFNILSIARGIKKLMTNKKGQKHGRKQQK